MEASALVDMATELYDKKHVILYVVCTDDDSTMEANMNIFDAAKKFISSKRRRFPILENGKLVGQISQKDILKAALKMKGNNW